MPLHTARVRTLFLSGLGFTYFVAFTSLARQVLGLYGQRGILPAREFLASTRESIPRRRWLAVPSIFWLGASDAALVRACRLGQGLSLALMVGLLPRVTLALAWGLYLSFVSIGGEFLAYQWDTLLLETSVHAWFACSRGRRQLFASAREDPPWQAVLLMRSFVARFFYEAGIAKIRSGDRAWRRLEACSHHYETQPLPTPLSWWAHRLPRRLQQLSTFSVLAIECGAPALAFGPRGARRIAFAALTFLQVLIAATGNFGFFNLLSIVLATWLLDDAAVSRASRGGASPRRPRGVEQVIATGGLAVLLTMGLSMHLVRYGKRARPRALVRLASAIEPLRSTAAYGLFAVMTARRPEIVIEGSDDGEHWVPYEFRYKLGAACGRASWVAPHQPRLDWQMWFAALELPSDWFARLLVRLLEGAPEVLALLDPKTPWREHPPRAVRALLYQYWMTDEQTRKATGEYWHRKLLGSYFAPMMLEASQSGHRPFESRRHVEIGKTPGSR